MTKPTKIVVDCSTGETSIIELTAEEIAYNEEMAVFSAARETERAAAEAAKADAKLSAQAKLQALGLTGEEIAALG